MLSFFLLQKRVLHKLVTGLDLLARGHQEKEVSAADACKIHA
jgi:hypothetical protein